MDEFIDKLIAFREEKRMLESKLNEAKSECEKIKAVVYFNEEKFIRCNREKQSLEKDYRKLNNNYLQLRSDYNAVLEKNSKTDKELSALSLENRTLKEENLKLKENHKRRLCSYSERSENTIPVRELVEQLIIYAERENKSTAREIRIALEKKMSNGFVPSEALTPEFKQRLDNLGRENPVIINNTSYNYSPGSTHQDYRRTLNLEKIDNVGKIIDKQ